MPHDLVVVGVSIEAEVLGRAVQRVRLVCGACDHEVNIRAVAGNGQPNRVALYADVLALIHNAALDDVLAEVKGDRSGNGGGGGGMVPLSEIDHPDVGKAVFDQPDNNDGPQSLPAG